MPPIRKRLTGLSVSSLRNFVLKMAALIGRNLLNSTLRINVGGVRYERCTKECYTECDSGVPFKLIDCYDSKTPYDKGQFDEYEQHIDQEISRLFT